MMAKLRPPIAASVPANRMTVSSSFTSRLVGFGNADDFSDAGERFQVAAVHFALIAGDADSGALGSGKRVSAKAQPFNSFADCLDLLLRCLRLHDNQHVWTPRTLSLIGCDGGEQLRQGANRAGAS